MMVFSLNLIDQATIHDRSVTNTNAVVSLVLAIVGASLMLFAVGEWRRWAYLAVFLSIPATFIILTVLPQRITDSLGLFGLPGLALILASVAWAAYLLSRRYYRRRGGA
jgi:uncharacterized membrane protein